MKKVLKIFQFSTYKLMKSWSWLNGWKDEHEKDVLLPFASEQNITNHTPHTTHKNKKDIISLFSTIVT